MPGSNRSVVADAKDLKPFSVRLLRYTRSLLDDGWVLRCSVPTAARAVGATSAGEGARHPTGPPVRRPVTSHGTRATSSGGFCTSRRVLWRVLHVLGDDLWRVLHARHVVWRHNYPKTSFSSALHTRGCDVGPMSCVRRHRTAPMTCLTRHRTPPKTCRPATGRQLRSAKLHGRRTATRTGRHQHARPRPPTPAHHRPRPTDHVRRRRRQASRNPARSPAASSQSCATSRTSPGGGTRSGAPAAAGPAAAARTAARGASRRPVAAPRRRPRRRPSARLVARPDEAELRGLGTGSTSGTRRPGPCRRRTPAAAPGRSAPGRSSTWPGGRRRAPARWAARLGHRAHPGGRSVRHEHTVTTPAAPDPARSRCAVDRSRPGSVRTQVPRRHRVPPLTSVLGRRSPAP